MNTIKILILLFIATIAISQNLGPQIIYVSSNPTSVVSPVQTSLRGGALIYIKIIGHNPVADQNKVYIGTYPCKIPSDGVSDTFISCYTTDTNSKSDINNLPVTVISYGKSFTTTYPNTVYFQNHYTPKLSEVFPNSGIAYTSVNYYGIHKISDLGDGGRNMGDVVKLLLGNDLCSRFDI